jgi:aminopeptidase YwaD
MLKKGFLVSILVIMFGTTLFSQDIDYARYLVDTLSSKEMLGRGYVNSGVNKAADLLSVEMKKMGLKKWDEDYMQKLSFPINTFPEKQKCVIGDKELTPLEDFLVQCNSGAVQGKYSLYWVMDTIKGNKELQEKIKKKDLSNSFIVTIPVNRELRQNVYGAKGCIFLKEGNLGWFVSWGFKVVDYCVLDVAKEELPKKTKKIEVDINNLFHNDYQTENVIGYIEGSEYPDSFYVFTAHYDHLGSIGPDNYFPGASDNASGTAMVMDLANYFSEEGNQPKYSIAFMLFTGEEAGLLGSFYYTEHPSFPLNQIKLVINLDMVGSGSDGITLVNSTKHPAVYNKFVEINNENEYLVDIKKRGPSANSDHHPFDAKDVPAIFIYTRGKETPHYHTMFDVFEIFPYTEYEDLFKLLIGITE